MHTPPSDDALVAAALNGDRQAFNDLVTRHHSRVIGLLRQLSQSPHTAADLAQDSFLQAWQKLASYQQGDRFGAWVARIAYRMFLQSARRSRLEDRVFRHEADTAEAIEQPASTAQFVPPDDTQAAQGLAGSSAFTELLCECSRAQQEALYMSYVLELTHAEIASITAQPIGSVKSHIKRGKLRVRRYLAANGRNRVVAQNE